MDNVDTFVDNVDNFVDMWVKFDILGRKLVKKGDKFQDIGVNEQNTMWTKCKQHGERLRIPPKNFLKLWIMWITFWVTAETDMLSLADEAKSEVGIHNFCSPCGMLIGVL